MPLSWHVGASVGGAAERGGDDAAVSRLAKPPRSLVSVESAGETRLARKHKPPGLAGTRNGVVSSPSTPLSSADPRSPKVPVRAQLFRACSCVVVCVCVRACVRACAGSGVIRRGESAGVRLWRDGGKRTCAGRRQRLRPDAQYR